MSLSLYCRISTYNSSVIKIFLLKQTEQAGIESDYSTYNAY